MRISSDEWLKAQYSVIGSALIDSRVVPKIISETSEQDFNGPCLAVYRAIRQVFMSGSAVDPVSVAAVLGSEYRDFMVQVMEITPTAANIDRYIPLCKEQARLLAVRDIAGQLLHEEDTKNVRGLLEQASGLMAENHGRKQHDMQEALRSFMDRHSGTVDYISWPFPEFNERIFSELGDFIILGAEPSVGKTALALQCAWHWARTMKVGFFSFETSSEKLFDRLMASLVGLDMKDIKNNSLSDRDWQRVCGASEKIISRKLDLIQAAGMSAADIRSRILSGGYQMIVIDYLQLVSAKGGSRYEQVTNISIELHNMAQSLGVTVLALSQLSRTDDDRKPRNSDLRESGQLEQDADVILMLKLKNHRTPAGPREIYVTKNKEGELFMMMLAFDGNHQRFVKARVDGTPLPGKAEPESMATPAQVGVTFGQMTMLPDNTSVPFTK